ncbi:DUF4440 domain-containing protein [Sphingosinicella soli]|uniref:Ketosteroid isomerase-like protein n=1 Tax=Sphingosinicella soli TaxID=333708 RepID=A0A7W7B455_9SPHN|nr:nuclear transport factor 2 family protein [Sphingosinicella soli]MBB4632730.1 ketosteroid isomerase-like protein [Sphingosinicella soli]
MTDDDMRTLAKHFFDAVERGDVATLRSFYSDDARIWHNTDEAEQTADENAEALSGFTKRITDRVYADRRVNIYSPAGSCSSTRSTAPGRTASA